MNNRKVFDKLVNDLKNALINAHYPETLVDDKILENAKENLWKFFKNKL